MLAEGEPAEEERAAVGVHLLEQTGSETALVSTCKTCVVHRETAGGPPCVSRYRDSLSVKHFYGHNNSTDFQSYAGAVLLRSQTRQRLKVSPSLNVYYFSIVL